MKFLLSFLSLAGVMFAAAANDIIIQQRTSDNQFNRTKVLANGTGITVSTNNTHVSLAGTASYNGSLTQGNLVIGVLNNGTVYLLPVTAFAVDASNNIIISANLTATNLAGNISATTMDVTTMNLTNPIPWSKLGNGGQTFTLGSLIVGNNTTTSGQLAVGNNTTVLTANSSAALGMSWDPTNGTGNLTRSSGATHTNIVLAGVVDLGDGSTKTTASAITGNVVEINKGLNLLTTGSNITLTFNGTRGNSTSQQWFSAAITNNNATNSKVITIPSSFSTRTSTNITTVNVDPSGVATLTWRDDGTTYFLYGETPEGTGITQNAQTGNYTVATTDNGKHIYHAAGAAAATYTIPANATISTIGFATTFVNMSANNVTITLTTDTLNFYNGTASTTGNRTLVTGGVATALKVGTGDWVISGNGLQ